MKRFEPVIGQDVGEVPVRLLFTQDEAGVLVDQAQEPMVMTVPHLILRELIAFLVLTWILVMVSLLWDAPLEAIANPSQTPNPSKAPWYFLGLQELLHYYPPLIAGIVLPGLAVLALVIIPYFEINIRRPPLFDEKRGKRLAALWVTIIGACVAMSLPAEVMPWVLVIPTLLGGLVITGSALGLGVLARLQDRSLAFWLMSWFILELTVLTIVGTFFRGPFWMLTLPWIEGIY